ncbi:MAG: sigma-70 family RNA polymerase sigma factor [Desulfococcaceae bacterium]|jgi:RNA polymerase sigma factor (sigma-70 family)|nr:sigma-70 family RNA polymerase sigma factor [Desulfococcaceae bacterium]
MKKTTSKEFLPCSEGKNQLCQNCQIDSMGLCVKFCAFVKRWLLPYTRNEIEREISHKTFEAIFKNIKNMETVRYFSAYCRQIFRNQKAEVFRSESRKFEKEQIAYAHQLQSGDDKDANDIIENYFQDNQSEDNLLITERTVLMQEVLNRLEEMISDEEKCAELVLFWYSSMKEGQSQKEMAQQMKMKQNTFNQELRRCKDRISQYFKS